MLAAASEVPELVNPFLSMSLRCSSKAGSNSFGTGFKFKWDFVSRPRSCIRNGQNKYGFEPLQQCNVLRRGLPYSLGYNLQWGDMTQGNCKVLHNIQKHTLLITPWTPPLCSHLCQLKEFLHTLQLLRTFLIEVKGLLGMCPLHLKELLCTAR